MSQEKDKMHYDFIEHSDFLSESFTLPIFNYAKNLSTDQISMLSLFSGCGGMDIGFEGGFICHRKSIPKENCWIEQNIDNDWVLLKKNRFNTIFANDILGDAVLTWTNYMKRRGKDVSIYHTESIVDLVKAHQNGADIFPDTVDIVTGGFPCQDFSVAGKRKGFASDKGHDGKLCDEFSPSEETRGKLYYWMKQVIDITKPKIFVAENVKGLVSLGDVHNIIQRDFATADNDGYFVFPPQILHAGNFGVPETRERVIFIGVRKSALREDIRNKIIFGEVPQEYNPYPKPTHNYNVGDVNLLTPISCRDVLSGLKEPQESLDISHM